MALVLKDEVAEAPINDFTVAMDDASSPEQAQSEDAEQSDVVAHIKGRYNRAKDARLTHENRWLRAYRNFRGLYGPDVQFTETERSRVFLKITKTKVQAAYGQIIDVLFAGNKFPLGVDPTKVPEGVAESVHFDPKAAPETEPAAAPSPFDGIGYEGDGKEIKPGALLSDLLGPLKDELADVPGLKEGPGVSPTAITFEPALVAAKKMEKKIHDQLDESNGDKHLRQVSHECVVFGTGVMKGPFTQFKDYPKWENGKYMPISKKMPRIEAVSLWDIYPDPDAITVDECDFIVQRHKMSRSQLRALKKRPYFRENAIEAAIFNGTNYVEEWWENTLRDNQNNNSSIERWEVLEYWGTIDADIAEEAGLEIPEELADRDEIQVNIWICENQILRLVMNPFTPNRIPFQLVPFELNPYSIFGIGVPENMDDTQTLMNGFMRMAVDNAVLSGNLVFEVDETNLVPGQDLRIFPGKVFRRQGGAPGQAIFGTKFPNTTGENLQMFDKARQLADESTGIPSFSHGQTGVSGVGRTAAGISMLMGAAATNIKTVVKNFDDYLLRPLGEALFAWNMQFDPDEEIVGDLEVNARGTESLLRNEVRSQRMMQFMQLGANPNIAPFIKWQYLIRETAMMLDLDPEKVCNSMDEAARQAALMQKMGGQPNPDAGANAAAGEQPVAGGMSPNGNGNGNMGVGSAPTPGEAGFTGSPPANPAMGGQ